jgi:hypothetical protein
MNSLQLWLAVLGGVVLAALLVHGAWQTRRAGGARRSSPAPTQPHQPPREPSFDDPVVPAGVADGIDERMAADERSGLPGESQRIDPVIHLPTRRPIYSPRVDALIDGIANLALEGNVSGETVLLHLPPSRRAGGKPFTIEGRHSLTGEWELPVLNTWYSELQAGVQLANRLGSINEIEFSEFVQIVQAFADAVGATPDFPDMLDVVARGRELDTFASGHDAQLVMRLRARGAAWPVGLVAVHAARHGFVHGVTAGRLVLPASIDGAPPMLALQFNPQAAMADDPKDAQVSELTLMFDVPQTPAYEEPFNAWCAAGQALAITLDAQVFDDQGQLLQPSAFPQIAEELATLYAKLAERDLAAGTLAARRLFS